MDVLLDEEDLFGGGRRDACPLWRECMVAEPYGG